MPNEPLIQWPRPIFEFLEFVGAILAAGAVGFRYAVARGRLGGADSAVYRRALGTAAGIGLLGAVLGLHHVWMALPGLAARRHTTVTALLTGSPPAAVWVGLTVLAVLGFALALGRRGFGWPLAAVAVVVGMLRGALFGQFAQLVKPVHLLAAGLWIGTLFVLVAAGLPAAFRVADGRDRRGAVVADMVRSFSPLALTMGGVLALFGLILAFRELERLDMLWSTPYGIALSAKLVVVAFVFSLGAYNWQRQKPKLGSEESARSLRGTASGELALALLVVLITAILASLPSPKGP